MKQLKRSLFFVVATCVIFVEGAAVESVGDKGHLRSLTEKVLTRSQDFHEIETELAKTLKASSGSERVFIEKLSAVMKNVGQNPTDEQLKWGVKYSVELLRELGNIDPDSFETQLSVASQMMVLSLTAKQLGMKHEDYEAEACRYSKRVAEKFPDRARAHGNYAFALSVAQGDPSEILRHLKMCLKIDPNDSTCKEAYRATKESYEAPYCEGGNIHSDIGMFLVQKGGDKKARFGGEFLELAKEPIFISRDVLRLSGGKNDFAQSVVNLELGRAAATKLEDVSSKKLGERVALRVGERVVFVAPIYGKIANGRVQASQVNLSQVCTKVQSRKIPQDLRWND